jgi:hypothetical protein
MSQASVKLVERCALLISELRRTRGSQSAEQRVYTQRQAAVNLWLATLRIKSIRWRQARLWRYALYSQSSNKFCFSTLIFQDGSKNKLCNHITNLVKIRKMKGTLHEDLHIVTDLINPLPGNSSVNTVQHATIYEAVFSLSMVTPHKSK